MVLDVGDLLGITDHFVITSGSNVRQVRTIAEEIELRVKEQGGGSPRYVEGLDDARWVLLDYGQFVVHVFLAEARRYLAYRFPGMKDAPLVETRVCQYENTIDHNFIVDRHPANANVWILGGGSGHGFKHGPALGEMVASLVLKDETADSLYRLARFRS